MGQGPESTFRVRAVSGVGVRKDSSAASLGQKVRVFIGTEPKTEIARKVLEVSIRRRTEAEVEFVPMIGKEWEYDHSGFHVGTGFSLRRWMIAEYCNWHGRAIYLDSDQIVFGDIHELHVQPDLDPRPGCAAWMTYQPSKFSKTPHPNSSVMVIDCAAAKAQPYFHLGAVLDLLRKSPERYPGLMYPNWMTPPPGKIPVHWNNLNIYYEGKTKLLHYTKEPEQPWYRPDHPYAVRWQMEFQIALATGAVTPEEVREAVTKYDVKEDWRSTNGLHPEYLKFIEKPKDKRKAKP